MYISIILIAILLTYYFVKRFRPQSGILTYLITFAIVSPITLAGTLLPITVVQYIKDLNQSETYNAKIVDFVYETREKTDSSDHTIEVTVKVPVFQLVTSQGDTITKEAVHYNSSYSYKEETMYCKVNYNPSTGNVFITDRGFYKMLSVMIFFALFFDFLLVGIVLYALGKDMTRYKQMLGIVVFRITIPMAILGFAVVLLFAAYEENHMSLLAKIACISFGVLLLLASIGLIILSNSKNKKRNRNRKRNSNTPQNNQRSHPSFLEFQKLKYKKLYTKLIYNYIYKLSLFWKANECSLLDIGRTNC